MRMDGLIHSMESFGAVDGPGLRFIVFLRGCPLKCLYCHNPDTWAGNGGVRMSATELADKIMTYRSFIKGGGVTISGGEPLLQPEFCLELCTILRKRGFHTALDTGGSIAPQGVAAQAIAAADMLLLDIKDIDTEDCARLTGFGNENALATLGYCEKIAKPVWIRHVLLPGYTLNAEKLTRLRDYLARFTCVEKTELLPYHTMGRYKWDELGLDYALDGVEPPSDEELAAATAIFSGG